MLPSRTREDPVPPPLSAPARPPPRRALRRLAAVGFSLLLLVGVELGLRVAGVAEEPTWVPTRVAWVVKNGALQQSLLLPAARRFVREGDTWTTNPVHRSTMRPQTFPVGSAPYFAIGESAVVGQAPSGRQALPRPAGEGPLYRPTPGEVILKLPDGPGILAEEATFAAQVAAATGVPVVNMGRVAQDSGEHVAAVKEALELGASGLLLYYGNNESLFLPQLLTDEAIPSVTRDRLRHLRLYRLLLIFRTGAISPPLPTIMGIDRLRFESELPAAAVERLWAQAGHVLLGPDGLPDDTLALAVESRFRTNLTRMADRAAKAGVPLWFIACPPALHYPPFASAHAPDAPDPAAADRLVASATAAFLAGNGEAALADARAAVEADAGFAAAWYILAVSADLIGDAPTAVDAALRAAALDPSHKRSTPAFTRIAREVCSTRGCITYDLHADLVAEARVKGLYQTYQPWFGDFEHPRAPGHAQIAARFTDLILGRSPAPTGGVP